MKIDQLVKRKVELEEAQRSYEMMNISNQKLQDKIDFELRRTLELKELYSINQKIKNFIEDKECPT